MGGPGSGQHNNHRAMYLVVELCDPADRSLPRYVAAQGRRIAVARRLAEQRQTAGEARHMVS